MEPFEQEIFNQIVRVENDKPMLLHMGSNPRCLFIDVIIEHFIQENHHINAWSFDLTENNILAFQLHFNGHPIIKTVLGGVPKFIETDRWTYLAVREDEYVMVMKLSNRPSCKMLWGHVMKKDQVEVHGLKWEGVVKLLK